MSARQIDLSTLDCGTALQHALALAERGFAVFPCLPDKSPATGRGFKDASRDLDAVRAMWGSAGSAAVLVGIATGDASGVSVLDIDTYKPEGRAWLDVYGASLPETFTTATLRGGRHSWFRHRHGLRSCQQPGVDIRADGGYVIWWPAAGCPVLSDSTVADWPPALDDLLGTRVRTITAKEPDQASLKAIDTATLGAIVRQMPNGTVFDDRSMWVAFGHALQAAFADNPELAEELWFHHADKRHQRDGEVEKVWNSVSPPHQVGAGHIIRLARECGVDTHEYDAIVAAREFSAQPLVPQQLGALPSTADLQRTAKGAPLANLANALAMLRNDTNLEGIFKYDEMSRLVVLTRPVPSLNLDGGAASGQRPIRDVDVSALQEYVQRRGLPQVSWNTVHDAVRKVADERTFHPVREYLESVAWDGTRRLDGWLTTYLGAEATPYAAGIGRMFLVSMVARIFKPGVKSDYMLILEGPQGARKSTACAILAGEWFSDNLPELHHGDPVRLSMHLRGRWLIEIAEMSSISKAEAGALKAFLTRSEERYTPKHARNEVVEPRQVVFVGTTNQTAYLRDETGGRRFWPVAVGQIDTAALARDRDQLFAEAVRAFRAGERWWPDSKFEQEWIAPQQEARHESDAWEAVIASYVAQFDRVLVKDVARGGLGIDTAKVGTAEQRRITAVLHRLGWQQRRGGPNGERYYYPPKA